MSINHNRIKVADLEKNQPNKILTTNIKGELEFSDINSIKANSYNALDYTTEGKVIDARQGKLLKDLIDNINIVLASDNINLNTIQKLVDTIETIQVSLNNIPVNTPSTEKSTIIDTDRVVIDDSEDSFSKKSVKWSTIKTILNSLFLSTSTDQNVSGIKTFLAGKFGFRNIANTFTSFFTNSNTASRTYTFPDKNGIVAMTSDISANTINTGTQNVIPKYGINGTSLGNSRITDNGSKILIGNNIVAELDMQFSAKDTNSIGSERTASGFDGSSFVLKAGDTSNTQVSNAIRKLNTGITSPAPTCCFSSNYSDNVFACAGTTMYKYTRESGIFSVHATGLVTGNSIHAGCESPTGDIYYINQIRQIYKQTGGTGSFLFYATVPGGSYGTGIVVTANNDIYACTFGSGIGKIYKQTNSTGSFVDVGATGRNYIGMTTDTNNNVYVTEGNNSNIGSGSGYIYKQDNGTTTFNQFGSTFNSWCGIVWDRISNCLWGLSGTGIYKISSSGTTVTQELVFGGLCNSLAICKTVLYTAWINSSGGNQEIWSYAINPSSTSDSNGGILKMKSGVGKGAGQSRIQFITGAKTVTGTNLQVETTRGYIDENGYVVWASMPTYSDNITAIAGGLPIGCEYKTATGQRMIVY